MNPIPSFWLPVEAALPARHGILIAKPGLDGHDRGAKYVAQVLRDAGYEVTYTGIRRTPEEIVDAALEKNVAAVGLSLLSGAHNTLFVQVVELLRKRGAAGVAVLGGGVIPADDVPRLLAAGVRAVFTPGASAAEIVQAFAEAVGPAAAASGNAAPSQSSAPRSLAS
jgi:methylmalonyl-CoA mutase C-terminal domain/subunit